MLGIEKKIEASRQTTAEKIAVRLRQYGIHAVATEREKRTRTVSGTGGSHVDIYRKQSDRKPIMFIMYKTAVLDCACTEEQRQAEDYSGCECNTDALAVHWYWSNDKKLYTEYVPTPFKIRSYKPFELERIPLAVELAFLDFMEKNRFSASFHLDSFDVEPRDAEKLGLKRVW